MGLMWITLREAPHAHYIHRLWCKYVEHTIGRVHAIKCVNKRDVHVAQSAIAQTETINHKCTVSRIALLLVPQVLSLGWNYTALAALHFPGLCLNPAP